MAHRYNLDNRWSPFWFDLTVQFNCLTFFYSTLCKIFVPRTPGSFFFCISCRYLCQISIFDGSGEWHCVSCIASVILKSDTLIFVFAACLKLMYLTITLKLILYTTWGFFYVVYNMLSFDLINLQHIFLCYNLPLPLVYHKHKFLCGPLPFQPNIFYTFQQYILHVLLTPK